MFKLNLLLKSNRIIRDIIKSKFLIILGLSFLIIACIPVSRDSYDRKISKEKKTILTTFTILADMARNVSGDIFFVDSITKSGAEVHGYQPTPSDLIRASKADLIIENGLGLELWARKFTSSAVGIPTYVLTKGIEPLLIEGDVYSGKPNPHAWMSPKTAMQYVDNLVEIFTEIKPSAKSLFQKNAVAYKSKLAELDKELREALSSIPKEKRLLVTCEGAFSYLANDYGMDEAYLWPVNAESQVTPKRMLRLIAKIKQTKVPAIFCESTVNSKAQIEVAKTSGVKFGGTFYVDSLSGPSGPAPTLLDLHRHNLRLIQKGLTSLPY